MMRQEYNKITGVDFVPAIPCPVWPHEAAEWVIRKRCRGWPSPSLIERCVEQGCYNIVKKAHDNSNNPNIELRFSFSYAETELIPSWYPEQTEIYMSLKRIKSFVSHNLSSFGQDYSILSSYHIKTLMFWSIEQKSSEFWAAENIVESSRQLLCEMIEWLIDRRCPNYFIRSNNMFNHITDNARLTRTIDELTRCVDRVDAFIDIFFLQMLNIVTEMCIPRRLAYSLLKLLIKCKRNFVTCWTSYIPV